MENLDTLDDLQTGRPQELQPDWAKLEIVEEIHRQQSLFSAPWEEDEVEP